jgi:hypothetical protein
VKSDFPSDHAIIAAQLAEQLSCQGNEHARKQGTVFAAVRQGTVQVEVLISDPAHTHMKLVMTRIKMLRHVELERVPRGDGKPTHVEMCWTAKRCASTASGSLLLLTNAPSFRIRDPFNSVVRAFAKHSERERLHLRVVEAQEAKHHACIATITRCLPTGSEDGGIARENLFFIPAVVATKKQAKHVFTGIINNTQHHHTHPQPQISSSRASSTTRSIITRIINNTQHHHTHPQTSSLHG